MPILFSFIPPCSPHHLRGTDTPQHTRRSVIIPELEYLYSRHSVFTRTRRGIIRLPTTVDGPFLWDHWIWCSIGQFFLMVIFLIWSLLPFFGLVYYHALFLSISILLTFTFIYYLFTFITFFFHSDESHSHHRRRCKKASQPKGWGTASCDKVQNGLPGTPRTRMRTDLYWGASSAASISAIKLPKRRSPSSWVNDTASPKL